jgi:beta-phosphoglucomutase-like phosphatase (HAD superfamily)
VARRGSALSATLQPRPALPGYIHGIVLDMDGVMLDTEVLYRQSWQQAARELLCDLTDAMYGELVGRRTEECERQMQLWFGPAFPVEQFHCRWNDLWADATATSIPTKSGLLELLDWADDQRLPVAVATSTEAPLAHMSLHNAGLAGRVPCIVTGDQVTASKPAPDIYQEAARRLGLDCGACIAIEDSEAGIASAHAAGMRPILVPDLQAPSARSAALAWRICATLDEARELIAAQRRQITRAEMFVERLCRWASARRDVRAVVVVGSYARGQALPTSDIDVVLIVLNPAPYLGDRAWFGDLGVTRSTSTEVYGDVTSLRGTVEHALEVELSIAPRHWASQPLDEGTRVVAEGGFVVLLDRDGEATALSRQRARLS